METVKGICRKMLNFDTMITPTIIKVIYAVFTSISILYGLSMILGGFTSHLGGGFKVIMGLFVIVLSPFLTRIWCETMIVIFKINENLGKLVKQNQDL